MLESKTYIVFFKYAIPSILGLLSISSANIVDGYFIGNYIGAVGLAAINISFPILAILFGLGLMFAVGSSVTAGKLMGEKKVNEASNIFTKSVIIVALLSITLSLLLHFNIEFILDILNVKNSLREMTLEYLPTLLLFLPFLITAIVVDYFVRVDENPNLSFIACLVSAVVNIILDYLFIVKFDWGLSAAAYATGISQIAIILTLIPHFFLKKATLKLIKPKGSFLSIVQMSKNGISEFINESSAGITVLIFNYIMLKNFGALGVASYTIIGYFIMISIMISFAIADSMQPVISKNYGAQYFNRIKSFLKLGFASVLFIEIVLSILAILTPELLINLFLENRDLRTKEITLEFISYAWPAFLFSGLNIMITSYLTSMQKAKYSALIAILRSLFLPIFFIFVLPIFLGTKGIFMALAFAEFITFLTALYLFLKNSPNKVSKNLKS
jgi:putative MATE family efflux protein